MSSVGSGIGVSVKKQRLPLGSTRRLALQCALFAIHVVFASLTAERAPLYVFRKLTLFNIPILDWIIALEVFVLLWNVFYFVIAKCVEYCRVSFKETENALDDSIVELLSRYTTDAEGFRFAALIGAGILIASNPLKLHMHYPSFAAYLKTAMTLLLGINVIDIAWSVVLLVISVVIVGAKDDSMPEYLDETRMNRLLRFTKPVFFLIGLVFVAQNVGIQVESLIASMGIGGLTIALSTQTLLQDVFSAIVLFIDQPFKEGDFIMISGSPGKAGTVEKIGFKSTKIRASDGEQLIYSNKDVSGARISRFDAGMNRRKNASWNIDRNTPLPLLKLIPEMIESTVSSKCDFVAAYLKEVTDSSFEFEVIFVCKSKPYLEFLKIQHEINMELLQKFENANISLAVPIRRIDTTNSSTIPNTPLPPSSTTATTQ
eukprot:CAMPEP_0182442902 /NCGR_PEP_ID=MMETSP1172-20130603/1762_1 /TAXON_ID=708627 /ORGANISM="Timspurckia oligopyrenoides, Strain CCMP3278" /LENGTH=429 /DNA_ID=CAMNT_0024637983 /DNA_START=1193 /DNA_END=2482 /DNA_ORIENTATION=+